MYWTRVEERAAGDVMILDVRGQVTVSDESKLVVDVIRTLLARKHDKIVVNLAHVPYIDSLGIGDIVRGFTAVQRAGGMLKLCGVAGRVRTILEATQLNTVIESYDAEQDALESFQVKN